MGNLASPQALIARWDELCRDPSLQDLPYKIEINAWGKVEMTPLTVSASTAADDPAARPSTSPAAPLAVLIVLLSVLIGASVLFNHLLGRAR